MKKGISPTFAVIAIILVIVIAGLLWYIYSAPQPTPGGSRGIAVKVQPPATPSAAEEAREKAAAAKAKMEVMTKPGVAAKAGGAVKAGMAAKPGVPTKPPAPTKP